MLLRACCGERRALPQEMAGETAGAHGAVGEWQQAYTADRVWDQGLPPSAALSTRLAPAHSWHIPTWIGAMHWNTSFTFQSVRVCSENRQCWRYAVFLVGCIYSICFCSEDILLAWYEAPTMQHYNSDGEWHQRTGINQFLRAISLLLHSSSALPVLQGVWPFQIKLILSYKALTNDAFPFDTQWQD